eukprot:2060105-Pyramimonas_sp.AAC.1
MNVCWRRHETPKGWHKAVVITIHKKGATDIPGNYRPISLLSLGYKIFASLVLERLLRAGADGRLSKDQFGFRSGKSTLDAICILRRRIEQAWALRGGNLYVLALDWKQAFDSVNISAMLASLERFGVPAFVLE